eukprot:s3503_g3.t1
MSPAAELAALGLPLALGRALPLRWAGEDKHLPTARTAPEPDPGTEAALAAARAAFAAVFTGTAEPSVEDVPSVPGAFLVRGAFTEEEARRLSTAVRAAHGGRAPRVAEERRRDSQHHRAVHVEPGDLEILARRLRPLLPHQAGPRCSAALEEPGKEVSTFLRCYRYLPGDLSRPHWDRSYCLCELTPNVLSSFSAFSLLLYANDDCEGGHTTFFEPEASLPASNKKLTPQCDRESLRVAAAIRPRAGDALVFPHGLHPGCHPSPLHEGSEVLSGEKLLVRTDIMNYHGAYGQVQDMAEGPLPSAPLIPAAQGEDGRDDESSPIEVSPSATREDPGNCPKPSRWNPLPKHCAKFCGAVDGDEDDATLSDDEAEDGEASEEELVSRPQPTFVPGKIKVMQRRQAEGEEVPKSSGDESEPTAAKIDPSRLPLEERERYYLQARARIFGESGKAPETPEVDAEDAPVVEDPQTDSLLDSKPPRRITAGCPTPPRHPWLPELRQSRVTRDSFPLPPRLLVEVRATPGGAAVAIFVDGKVHPNLTVVRQPGPQQNTQQNQQQQPQSSMQQQAMQQQALQQQALQQQALQQQALQQQALQQQVLQQQAMQQQAMQQQAMQQQALQQQAMQQAMQQLLLQQQSMQQQAMQQPVPQDPNSAGGPQRPQRGGPGGQEQTQQEMFQQRLQMVSAMFPNQQDRSDPPNIGNPRIAL